MSESVCPIQNLMRSSRHKYLGLAGVSTAFRYWIFHIWADAKEVIAYERKQESVYYEYFAKMESRLEKFERDEGRSFQMPNKQDLEYFYNQAMHLPFWNPLPRQTRKLKRR
jgi:hypothetical protein